jgi:pyruvate formate lyase activating enzyme
MAPGRLRDIEKPAIFSIQHFCLHDGPGVRSMVFFKGCPLRCTWCQNPESWRTSPEPAFKVHLCIDCISCVNICPTKAISAPGIRNAQMCDSCFLCVENCPSGAMVCFGKNHTADDVLEKLRPEFPYMKNTGGGVTFSGGEPTLFAAFIAQLAKRLHEEKVHVAMETCGYFDNRADLTFFANIDLVLFDIKLYDDAAHQKFCGTSGIKIKENLTRLAAQSLARTGPAIWLRMPLIPTVTDTEENLTAWAQFLNNIGIPFMTLVPYHNLGHSKREWLNLPPAPGFPAMDDERMTEVAAFLSQLGIDCYVPGEEDWRRIL